MDNEKPKGPHGGARKGAGRPALPDAIRRHKTILMVAGEHLQLLDDRAEREAVSRSEALSRCLNEWSGKPATPPPAAPKAPAPKVEAPPPPDEPLTPALLDQALDPRHEGGPADE